MSVSLTFTESITGTNISVSGRKTATVSGDSSVIANPPVLPAKAGTLTVRTSGTVGSLTMATGHGITTGQRIDLYWTGGMCYGCVVGTVSGLVVPIASTEGGDAFPIATTAIKAGICNQVAFAVTGDNVQGLVANSGVAPRAQIVLHDGTDDLLRIAVTNDQGDSYGWRSGTTTNPLAGVIPTRAYVSHDDTTRTITDIKAAAIIA